MFSRNFWKKLSQAFDHFSSTLICFFISFYKVFISGNLMMGGSCRFYPSCSDYAFLVYKKYSFLKASKLFIKRLLCCHPLGPKVREEPEIKGVMKHV